MTIPFFVQSVSEEMKNAAMDALQNENFVGGESVIKFEEDFARYIGTKHAIAVSSGNSALHLSLLALGISSNSKVVTPTNSFIASANCIKMTNAKPILADINPIDGNIDLNSVKTDVNAIIPVHIYGNPCDYDSVLEFSERQKIPIIEDACQAHGAIFRDKKVGSISDAGCFSFYPTKNMTVGGDGGMVTTDNEETRDKIRSIRDNGRGGTRNTFIRFGYTMRLNSVNAAMGRVQLRGLDEKNKRRQEIAELYRKKLKDDIVLPENPNGKSVYHQIVIKHKKRDLIQKHLMEKNIQTAIHYPIPIHKQPIYEPLGLKLENSEKFSNEILSLPSYPTLDNESIMTVCDEINKIL